MGVLIYLSSIHQFGNMLDACNVGPHVQAPDATASCIGCLEVLHQLVLVLQRARHLFPLRHAGTL